ncbi:uncharacterized protein LOC134246510 [Saccostrea cucullata]|uniref:uncharacterized protein LOC134246510 n=1 Tax=Saccostrea cuccullata TaxID=36930 RepID=UPI002ED08263
MFGSSLDMDPRNSAIDILLCDLCETAPLKFHCENCQINLCVACKEKHLLHSCDRENIVPYRLHIFATKYPKCQSHTQQFCKTYCEKCDIPICETCLSSDVHNGHSLSDDLQKINFKSKPIPPQKFLACMENGKTTVRHARGVVIGCAGVGKTTLLYRLMGKSLQEIKKIKSTRGLCVYEHIFSVEKGDLVATENDISKRRLIRVPLSALQRKEQIGKEKSMFGVKRTSQKSGNLENLQNDMLPKGEQRASPLTVQNSSLDILSTTKNAANELQVTRNEKDKKGARENETNDLQMSRYKMRKRLGAREKAENYQQQKHDKMRERLVAREKRENDQQTHDKIRERLHDREKKENYQHQTHDEMRERLGAREKEENYQHQTHDEMRERLGAREKVENTLQLTQNDMREILVAKENETSVSMIDFAGQFAYYACHQIYMRSETFYILVLDMSKSFNDVIGSELDDREGSIYSTWTCKDYVDFWLESIKSFGGKTPQILAVASHAEDKGEAEKKVFWQNFWRLIREEDCDWLGKCINSREFSLGLIEMKGDEENSLKCLKQTIAKVVSKSPKAELEVPSAWALLEHLLRKTEKPIMSLEEINKVNKTLPNNYQLKNQEEIFEFLSFFHDHGLLLFFKDKGLRKYAIFGMQWFSNAFSKLIADRKHISQDCNTKYIKKWECFNETGKLGHELVEALWTGEQSYLDHKRELMLYMERLQMLVSIVDAAHKTLWYVPCMNNKSFTRRIFKRKWRYSSILCFRFASFAMFVYYRLIAYCMSSLKWAVQLDKDNSPCLYHTAAIFETTENHTVIVGIFDNDIQIQVMRINNLQPKVSCEIGKSIEIALTQLTKTFEEEKTFQKGYKCLNVFCSEEDMSFIPEKKLSKAKEIQCNCPIEDKHEIDVHKTLIFWEEGTEECSKNVKSGSSGLNLDDRTRFAKVGMAINDVLTETLRDVLQNNIPSSNIFVKVNASKRYKDLNSEQQNLIKDAINSGYEKFDTTLLYTLIRNFSTITKPTRGWGLTALPASGEITVGDDVERIRLIRNNVFGHVNSALTSQSVFDDCWSAISDICTRLETFTGNSYLDELSYIENLSLEEKNREAIIDQIKVECKDDKEILEIMHSIESNMHSLKTGMHSVESNLHLVMKDVKEMKTAMEFEKKGTQRGRREICKIL